jgi:hypothetical protein
MKAMKVDRMRVRRSVDEVDANAVTFGGADGGAGYTSVVRPGWVEHAWRDLDLFVYGEKIVLAQRLSVGQDADLAIIKIGQHGGRIEQIGLRRIDIAGHEVAAVDAVVIDRRLPRSRAWHCVGHRQNRGGPGSAQQACRAGFEKLAPIHSRHDFLPGISSLLFCSQISPSAVIPPAARSAAAADGAPICGESRTCRRRWR